MRKAVLTGCVYKHGFLIVYVDQKEEMPISKN